MLKKYGFHLWADGHVCYYGASGLYPFVQIGKGEGTIYTACPYSHDGASPELLPNDLGSFYKHQKKMNEWVAARDESGVHARDIQAGGTDAMMGRPRAEHASQWYDEGYNQIVQAIREQAS